MFRPSMYMTSHMDVKVKNTRNLEVYLPDTPAPGSLSSGGDNEPNFYVGDKAWLDQLCPQEQVKL